MNRDGLTTPLSLDFSRSKLCENSRYLPFQSYLPSKQTYRTRADVKPAVICLTNNLIRMCWLDINGAMMEPINSFVFELCYCCWERYFHVLSSSKCIKFRQYNEFNACLKVCDKRMLIECRWFGIKNYQNLNLCCLYCQLQITQTSTLITLSIKQASPRDIALYEKVKVLRLVRMVCVKAPTRTSRQGCHSQGYWGLSRRATVE